jgi:hypothetical protein
MVTLHCQSRACPKQQHAGGHCRRKTPRARASTKKKHMLLAFAAARTRKTLIAALVALPPSWV